MSCSTRSNAAACCENHRTVQTGREAVRRPAAPHQPGGAAHLVHRLHAPHKRHQLPILLPHDLHSIPRPQPRRCRARLLLLRWRLLALLRRRRRRCRAARSGRGAAGLPAAR